MGLDQSMISTKGQKDYYWRKHARLQVFMARAWQQQNGNHDSTMDLGFNGGDEPVKITRELCDEWERQIKDNYWDNFATDGFFGDNSFKRKQ
jgi:hypothetical protein